MAINKQVVIKLDILQTKLDSVIQSVENLDFDLADGLDQSNIVYDLQECSDRVFELRQAVRTL